MMKHLKIKNAVYRMPRSYMKKKLPLQVVLSDVFTGISCTVGISLFSDLRY